MFEFLFDIKPDAGNVCPTTRLAYLISERGNKVYYTDTSDSVFTTGFMQKEIQTCPVFLITFQFVLSYYFKA